MRIRVWDEGLSDLVELSAEHPPVLYHATSERWLEAIRREGLFARIGDIPVHLADFDTTDFIHQFYPGDRIVLIKVNVEGLRLGPGWDGSGTYTSHYTIPPHRLTFESITSFVDETSCRVAAAVKL